MEQQHLPIELPEASDGLAVEELVSLLNTLLEAERAGAKVLTAFLDEYPRDSKAWNQLHQLHQLQQDEANNCAKLMNSIRSLGKLPSSSVGEFFNKALAVQGRAPRLIFLNRGQGWWRAKWPKRCRELLWGPYARCCMKCANLTLQISRLATRCLWFLTIQLFR